MPPTPPQRDPVLFDDPPPTVAGPTVAEPTADPAAAPDFDPDLTRLGRRLPPGVYLGTSSWSYPGWHGIVYRDRCTEAQLAHGGLAAYSRHPVLRAVGIDRSFHRPLAAADLARYAGQVPDRFRFVIKAPSQIADARLRTAGGSSPNPHFLDSELAAAEFARPVAEGLGVRAGALLLQLPPLPPAMLREPHALIDRIGGFLRALPRTHEGVALVYAVEVRDPELLTPRLVHGLRDAGARLCIGIHPRMPPATRQLAALRAMDATADEGDNWTLKGPLVVRWNLHAGFGYEQARSRYTPFDRLVDADIVTRATLAHLVHIALRSGQPAYVIANNKAEGCAPLTCIELARALVREER